MTDHLHRDSNHHTQLLWLVIILVALVTFLVDAAGWLPDGGLLP
ncbi:MAG TPA: hypothetical protein VFV62_01345 [Gaiellaceae bacterium]|nr:hypothetical protein [Gaiellaceae bacterium]